MVASEAPEQRRTDEKLTLATETENSNNNRCKYLQASAQDKRHSHERRPRH